MENKTHGKQALIWALAAAIWALNNIEQIHNVLNFSTNERGGGGRGMAILILTSILIRVQVVIDQSTVFLCKNPKTSLTYMAK